MIRGRRSRDGEQRREFIPKKKEWNPRTTLGKRVVSGEVTSLESLLSKGVKILEVEAIDYLVPDLKDKVLDISSTQRMTSNGRKMKMRAVVVVGNSNGFVGVGVGKANDTKDAIASAVIEAKKNLVFVPLACSSWECGCSTQHTVAQKSVGSSGNTKIELKPAPRGVGIVTNESAKTVLEFAGVKDTWATCTGRTRNVLNMVLATINAL
ncbi:30S ribosomal protein S5, partial [Candidatus Micrarchaeota archaeon]|nr:30S ribosomal protein S5 [Candidatus Micrarchaeota archaeon]